MKIVCGAEVNQYGGQSDRKRRCIKEILGECNYIE